MQDKHMGVAEVKRRFADVVGEVVYGRRRVIVERRGRPVVAIVPLEEPVATRTPGQQLAEMIGGGGKEGDRFYAEMKEVTAARRTRMPRPLPKDRR